MYLSPSPLARSSGSELNPPRTMVAPPAAAITPLDHRGWVIIATVLGVVLGLLALGVRLFIRIAISPPFGMDDRALWVATVRRLPSNYVAVNTWRTPVTSRRANLRVI